MMNHLKLLTETSKDLDKTNTRLTIKAFYTYRHYEEDVSSLTIRVLYYFQPTIDLIDLLKKLPLKDFKIEIQDDAKEYKDQGNLRTYRIFSNWTPGGSIFQPSPKGYIAEGYN